MCSNIYRYLSDVVSNHHAQTSLRAQIFVTMLSHFWNQRYTRVQRLRNFNTHRSKRHRNLLGPRARIHRDESMRHRAINTVWNCASLSTSTRLAIASYRVVIAMTRGNLTSRTNRSKRSSALETPSFATRPASKRSRHLFLSVRFPGRQEWSR